MKQHLNVTFFQSEKVHKNAKKSLVFESEKNSYNAEIEAIYLNGDFTVKTARFFHKSPIPSKEFNKNWVDRYYFVEFGLFL